MLDLQTTYQCALAAQLAYQVPGVSDVRASGVPCNWVYPWDANKCQGIVIDQDDRFIVAYRGTSYEDVATNTNLRMDPIEGGEVHSGFLVYAKCGFAHIHEILRTDPGKPVIFTGHSLGGAAAVIAAMQIKRYHTNQFLQVITFGAPRVGDSNFAAISHYLTPHERWVNANDGVPRVPLLSHGYRHSGDEFYITTKGKIWPKPNPPYVFFDRWGGFKRSPFRWATDKVADHRMAGYVQVIKAALEAGL